MDITPNLIALAVLRALISGSEPHLAYRDGELRVNGARVELPPAEWGAIDDRVRLLAGQVGLFDVEVGHLATVWAGAVAKDGGASARELMELGRSATLGDARPQLPLERWQDAMRSRLRDALPGLMAADRLTPIGISSEGHWLELGPILEDWPRQLLEDPAWAFTEKPLPDVEPLPLDEVWVDLCLSDPDTRTTPGAELRALLDRRYEAQQRIAEPAQVAVDRLRRNLVVVGAPGSGKTTLLKWFARRLLAVPDGRFLLPFFVPLRRYAREKQRRSSLDLLGFALEIAGVRSPRQRELWRSVIEALSSEERQTVLFLLDALDEVPAASHEDVVDDIEVLGGRFATVTSSRRSGASWRLRAERPPLEIAELSDEAVDRLVRRWFTGAGRAAQADDVLRHLDAHPDLRRLARSPFLLTLLCAICQRDAASGGRSPRSRTELYGEVIRRIVDAQASHAGDRDVSTALSRGKRFSLWLLEEAAGAPRYVFDAVDYEACCAETSTFDGFLVPSRLVSRWSAEADGYHFLHATFQEYFAAAALVDARDPAALERRLDRHLLSGAWEEIFHFAAGLSGDDRRFWERLRSVACAPDRVGFVFLRLARFLAEARVTDGGRELLGVDVREELFARVDRGVRTSIFAQAAAEFDPDDFLDRILRAIEGATGARRYRLIRVLGRVRGPDAARALLARLRGGDEKDAAVASYAVGWRPDREALARLRDEAADSVAPSDRRSRAIRVLGRARDFAAIEVLAVLARNPEFRDDAAAALGHIGGNEAAAALIRLFEQAEDDDALHAALGALGDTRSTVARDWIVAEIALRGPDDELTEGLLDALREAPLRRGTAMLIALLFAPGAAARRAATARALADSSDEAATDALARAARDDPDGEVRAAALEAIAHRTRAADAAWLERVASAGRTEKERANAITALLDIAVRGAQQREGGGLRSVAQRVIERALASPRGPEALAAAFGAHAAGRAIGPRLVEICVDPCASDTVREAACGAVAKLGYTEAGAPLRALVESAPDVPDDDEQIQTSPARRAARAAAEALAYLDPTSLLNLEGSTAFNALAAFAEDTGCLVFDHHVLDPLGRPLGGSREARAPASVTPVSLPALPRASALLVLRTGEGGGAYLRGEAKILVQNSDFLVLLKLARRKGRVVRYDELSGNDYAHKAISALRRALREISLGYAADAQRLLDALVPERKEGYRLALPAEDVEIVAAGSTGDSPGEGRKKGG